MSRKSQTNGITLLALHSSSSFVLLLQQDVLIKTFLGRNKIDQQLEVSIDILDDFVSESVEVTKANNWLSFGPPLYQLRELGISCRDNDMIDECSCTGDKIKNLCWKMSDESLFILSLYVNLFLCLLDTEAVQTAILIRNPTGTRNQNPEQFPLSVKDPYETPVRTRPWVDIAAEIAKVLGH
jgi:hypothetical protein